MYQFVKCGEVLLNKWLTAFILKAMCNALGVVVEILFCRPAKKIATNNPTPLRRRGGWGNAQIPHLLSIAFSSIITSFITYSNNAFLFTIVN